MNMELDETDRKGVAYYEHNGTRLAEMTYSKAGTNMIIIDHTEVNPQLQGQGVGKKLLMTIVQMARDQSKKILPLCPFAKSQFDKDPSIGGVL